ncbi:MAG: hypothetical protein V2B20_10515 [Pseudomonadota bacterium]
MKVQSKGRRANDFGIRGEKVLHVAMKEQDYMAVQSPSDLKARMNALTLTSQQAAEELLAAVRGNYQNKDFPVCQKVDWKS